MKPHKSPYAKPMQTRYLEPDMRKAEILDAAVKQSAIVGYHNITLRSVGTAAGCSYGLVAHYFGRVAELKTAVIREAIDRNEHRIVAQAVAMNHDAVSDLEDSRKREVALSLCS